MSKLNLKTYLIESKHAVTIDNYENGEGANVNNYDLKAEIQAINVKQAIKVYFAGTLFNDLKMENCDCIDNTLRCSVLVDNDNCEIKRDSETYKLWKNGNIVLFNNSMTISATEITKKPIKISDFV